MQLGETLYTANVVDIEDVATEAVANEATTVEAVSAKETVKAGASV